MKSSIHLPVGMIVIWVALGAGAGAQTPPPTLEQIRQRPLPPGAILIIPTGHARTAPQTQPSSPESAVPNPAAYASSSTGNGPTIYYPAGYYPYLYYYPGYTDGPEAGPIIYWPVGLAPVCGYGGYGGGFGGLLCGDNCNWLQTCLPNSFGFSRGGGFVSAGNSFLGGDRVTQSFRPGAFQGAPQSFHAFASTTELGKWRASGGAASRSFSTGRGSVVHGAARSAPAQSAGRRR